MRFACKSPSCKIGIAALSAPFTSQYDRTIKADLRQLKKISACFFSSRNLVQK